jgi:hypothetical protein
MTAPLPVEVAPDRGWPAKRAPGIAEAEVHAALEAQARRTVPREIKRGAHRYALCPSLLDSIECGLSRLTPRAMTARLKHLLAEEIATPRRMFGFGGYVPMLNLKSALVYARYSRSIERLHVRIAAEGIAP